jgi:hypothetical protein
MLTMLARYKLWLMIATVWAASASGAFAQHWTPFGPSDIRYDLELFKPPDLSTYANWPRPSEGMFFQYERLYWSVSQANRTDIGVPGGRATGLLNGVNSFDSLNQPIGDVLSSYGNSLDTGFLRADQSWGNRFEFGFIEDDKGWYVSVLNLGGQVQTNVLGSLITPAGLTVVFRDPQNKLLGFVDPQGLGFDADLNLTGPITPFNRVPSVFGRGPSNLDTTGSGRPTPGAFAGFSDFGDEVPLVPIFNTIAIRSDTSLNGVEINRTWRYPPTHIGGLWQLNLGLRWLILRDSFDVTATEFSNTIVALPGVSFWDTAVDNNMFGPQIGLRYDHNVARWDLMADIRFMAAINFQSTHLNGELGSALNGGPNPTNVPFQMVRTSFQSWRYDETFAPVGELRLGVTYKLTQAIGVMAGYNAMLGGGISRASKRIDYVLPAMQILDANKWDTFFTNGLSLGVEINR